MSECVKKVPVGDPDVEPVPPYEEWRNCDTTKTCTKEGTYGEVTIEIPCEGKERWVYRRKYQNYKLISTCEDCVVDGSIFREYIGEPFWQKEYDAICATDPYVCTCPDGYFS